MSEPVTLSAETATKPYRFERRVSVRYRPGPNACCRVIAVVGVDPWPAEIQTISMSGISMALSRRLEPENIVVLELSNPTCDFSRLARFRVLRARERRDGSILVAGTLSPQLSRQELEFLR